MQKHEQQHEQDRPSPRVEEVADGRRIYYLLLGLLSIAAIVAVLVFGVLLPTARERDRVDDNTDRAICSMTGNRCP